MSTLIRETNETCVRLSLRLSSDEVDVATGDDFLDHMLVTLSGYGRLGLAVAATGDLRHHLVEDVAISLGQALRRDTPAACVRYGEATIPMDEALVQAAIDLGGRAFYVGDLDVQLYEHFFYSLAHNAGMTLHLRVLRGRDRHHMVEAAMKALGLALRQALEPSGDLFSTKGAVTLRWEGEN
ncbi:MAG TPA: imidazoleglycerol-phosphate dehydratase [Longimicrobiaceae bacterium]|nr:imidazoleglycerol-phosphate dehydratase [Longimicrobiaceae bacterium]